VGSDKGVNKKYVIVISKETCLEKMGDAHPSSHPHLQSMLMLSSSGLEGVRSPKTSMNALFGGVKWWWWCVVFEMVVDAGRVMM